MDLSTLKPNKGSTKNNLPVRKPLFLTDKMVEQIIKKYKAHLEKEINRA